MGKLNSSRETMHSTKSGFLEFLITIQSLAQVPLSNGRGWGDEDEVQAGTGMGTGWLGAGVGDASTRWPSGHLPTFPSTGGVAIWPYPCN